MTATYQLEPYELTDDFLKQLKDTFDGRKVTITVEEAQDETAYLLGNEANRKILLERLESVKKGVVKHTLTMDEIEAMAQ